MNFKQALNKSLKADKHTHTDPFLLHSHVSDLVGNDYEAKKAAEEFYRLDAKYEISKAIQGGNDEAIFICKSEKIRQHARNRKRGEAAA